MLNSENMNIDSRVAILVSHHANDEILLLPLLFFAHIFIFSSTLPHSDTSLNDCYFLFLFIYVFVYNLTSMIY